MQFKKCKSSIKFVLKHNDDLVLTPFWLLLSFILALWCEFYGIYCHIFKSFHKFFNTFTPGSLSIVGKFVLCNFWMQTFPFADFLWWKARVSCPAPFPYFLHPCPSPHHTLELLVLPSPCSSLSSV